MNAFADNNDRPGQSPEGRLDDELAIRLSELIDGELSADEADALVARLQDDPAARRLAEELRAVSTACRSALHAQPIAPESEGFAAGVVAEALRRQAATPVAADTSQADRLEPEGEFGLPFGKSSRNWMWGAVAAAAAVMLTVFSGDRTPPARPGVAPPNAQAVLAARRAQYDQALAAMRSTTPNLRVVPVTATPESVARLRQRLAAQQRPAELPQELMAVSQRGVVVQPIDPTEQPAPGPEAEELVYVEADDAELDRLIAELGAKEAGAIHRVAPSESAAPGVAPAKVRAVPFTLRVNAGLAPTAQPKPTAPASGRRVIVLRIRVQRQP